jgi:hypothetical protein
MLSVSQEHAPIFIGQIKDPAAWGLIRADPSHAGCATHGKSSVAVVRYIEVNMLYVFEVPSTSIYLHCPSFSRKTLKGD